MRLSERVMDQFEKECMSWGVGKGYIWRTLYPGGDLGKGSGIREQEGRLERSTE